MKRVTTIGVAAVFACAIAAAAQTTQTGQQPQGQTPQTETQRQGTTNADQTGQRQTATATQAQGRAATSMFIGCVEKGTTPNAFVLSVTEMPGTAGASATARGTSGTTGNTRTGTAATAGTTTMVGHRMELIGGTNLAAHVGHKVEITGMVVPQGNAAGRPAGQPAADMRVNVTNLRMIDTNCTAATGTRGTTSEPAPKPGY